MYAFSGVECTVRMSYELAIHPVYPLKNDEKYASAATQVCLSRLKQERHDGEFQLGRGAC